MSSYYLLRVGGRPQGPISKSALCRMAEAGQVGPEDEVAPTASGPWTPLRKVPKLAERLLVSKYRGQAAVGAATDPAAASATEASRSPGEAAAPSATSAEPSAAGLRSQSVEDMGNVGSDFAFLYPAKIVERLMLDLLSVANGGLLEDLSRVSAHVGHAGVVLGSIAVTTFALVFALRLDSLRFGLLSVAVPIVFAVLQYGDWKFLGLASRVVRNTPSRTSGMVLYHLLGFILVLAAVAAFIAGGYLAVQQGLKDGWSALGAGIGLGIYLGVMGFLFLTPNMLNLHEDHTCSAGQDGLALTATALKAGLAAAKFVFGSVCALGAVAATVGTVWFIADASDLRGPTWFSLGALLLGIGMVYPIVAYIFAVIYYILIDVLVGIIRLAKQTAG